ncbi:DUF3040 domain-containing protein [Streptomyces sp. LARHCF249]
MNGRRLSPGERRALAAIERSLSQDPRFERKMAAAGGPPPHRTGRPGAIGRLQRRVCALALVSAALLLPAAATSSPALIWAFTASYAATLACLVLLVRRWCRRGTDGPG